ncbi:hypothetical protein PAE9249_04921 [Paenibacillus sp. CECT 9249]|nr:hypothetical protein PAE9249_04921 [Paenibacillus sp. CECT 9249]
MSHTYTFTGTLTDINSLVVLPFALALPEPLNQAVSAVIVTQTIVELIGELFYIRLVPKVLLRGTDGSTEKQK